mgnify:FL=1|jgi:hypothetical protein
MSIANKIGSGNRVIQQQIQNDEYQLNKEDIEYVLNKIREMQFMGSELEVLTRIVIKLQNQYTNLNK